MNERCEGCGRLNHFAQRYKYHAGFGDQGFLYNDAGTCTLIWFSYDPDYSRVVGPKQPWYLSAEERSALEDALAPAPSGGRWRFSNPPRCTHCGAPIGRPILEDIYFFVYDGSLNLDEPGRFREAMRDAG